MMFFLVLRIAGEIALIMGPMTAVECEARRAVMAVDRPAFHELKCHAGRMDVEMKKQ